VNHTSNIITILIIFTLLLLLSSCSSKPVVSQQTIEVQSKQEVVIGARDGAQSYRWSQLSGMSVVLVDTDKQTLRFIAPEVEREERLVFEVEVKFGDTVQKVQVTVVVSPLGDNTDDNSTDDTNSSSGGGSDDNATAGNSNNNTTIEGDDNTITTPQTVILISLKLTIDKNTLNKEENTTVKVIAIYSDNTTKEVTEKVEWLVTPSDTVKITSTTLKVLKDRSTTVKAKINTVTSDAISLNIYWEINGHTLPPEPDKTTNDATLLGVDVNNNNVRDDVERWIYETYKDKHPIHIDIAMQAGRAWQKVLEDPTKAKEIHDYVSAPVYCEGYYMVYAGNFGDINYIKEKIITKNFDRKVYNTKEREEAYLKYQTFLSGDSYTVPWPSEGKKCCDFNTSKYED